MKTLLLIIAITLTANADAHMCDYHITKLDKSIAKVRNFVANDMESYMKIELTKVKFYAVHALSECERPDQIDLANHALLVAKGLSR